MSITACDHLNNLIILNDFPKKIVSVVPSQTELLSTFYLHNEVVGITKFCVHPQEWFQAKTRVGGTKTLNLKRIKSLQPDLVLANKEENVEEQIDALRQICSVYVSDVNNLPTALQMISDIGHLTGKENDALLLNNQITKAFQELCPARVYKVAYLMWHDPYMAAAADTFISDLMERCGFQNVFKDALRYPVTSVEELRQMQCEVLLLSSEPFPFAAKHVAALQPLLPHTKICLVDGEMFSWYGSRLVKAAQYFERLMKTLR